MLNRIRTMGAILALSCLLSLLSGCSLGSCSSSGGFSCGGGRPFNPAVTCTVQGLGAVHLEDARDCECIAAVLGHAVTLVHSTVGAPAVDFSTVDVWVYAGNLPGKSQPGAGVYTLEGEDGGRVRLGRDMLSAAHELLHHVELRHRDVDEDDSLDHFDWAQPRFGMGRSFRQVDEEFRRFHDARRPGAVGCE